MSKRKRPDALSEEQKADLTPMIDVVFLMLAFFMVTTDLTQEADLGLKLPANVPPDPTVQLPNEHVVDIEPSGQVFLNGIPMDAVSSRTMPQLVNTLRRLKASAGDVKTAVTIMADPESLHQRSIDVMNACAQAEIKYVSFSAE